jgi:alkylation response protein AidB-like acyl-CoA dehydrogenase
VNVRVPDAYRIGEVNGALRAMAKALEVEQSGGDLYTHGLRELLAAALDWAKSPLHGCQIPIEQREVKLILAGVATNIEVQDVLVRRSVWSGECGRGHKAFGPMSKLFGSETWMEGAHTLMSLAAPESLERGYSPLGIVEKQARRGIPATIYAGTSEIQRSIIAESALGLPRSR